MNVIQNSRVSLNMEFLDMHTIIRSLCTVRSEPKGSDSSSVKNRSVYLTTTQTKCPSCNREVLLCILTHLSVARLYNVEYLNKLWILKSLDASSRGLFEVLFLYLHERNMEHHEKNQISCVEEEGFRNTSQEPYCCKSLLRVTDRPRHSSGG
jgi:hypothetical protein